MVLTKILTREAIKQSKFARQGNSALIDRRQPHFHTKGKAGMEMDIWDIQAYTGKKKQKGQRMLEDVELQVYDFFIIKTNLKVQLVQLP